MVNKAINLAVETQWREDISSRSSLKYINPESVKVGKAHHVWSSVHNNLHDSHRGQLKSLILTGTYTLQSNRAVFNQFAVDPTCKLCDKSPETRQHFLAECQTLQHVRQKFFTRIQCIVDPSRLDITSLHKVTQLILDSSVFFKSKTIIDSCELYSRELISPLHHTRNKLLSSNEMLLLLSAFWPKYLSGRKALWYFFHGKNSQVHYIRHVYQVGLSRKVNKIIEF